MRKGVFWFATAVLMSMAFMAAKPSDEMSLQPLPVADEWTDCLETYKTQWGDEDCNQCKTFKDTYKVYVRNKCEQAIDLKCCMQEENKSWRCFSWLEVNQGDSIAAYACKSHKGKMMWWAREAGDKAIVFPTNDEVNKEYGGE